MKNIDSAICLLSLRRVLEAICKDKGAVGKDLDTMVKDLIAKKLLPDMLDDACWIIRQLGNSAAHADEKVFYKHQVEQTTEFVKAIIDYLYVLPSEIGNLKSRVQNDLNRQKNNQP